LVERIAVNTGTVLVLPAPTRPAWRVGLGPPSADRSGTGRSRRSSRSVGEPRTGRRVAAVARRKEAAMPKDAPVNIGAPPGEPTRAHQRVSGMQAKLHRWAAADGRRRFDDLFNLVCDPATLLVAFERVAGNTGANTPGVDGLT